jgi:nucleotide-binding universal stress UspA family protein
MRILLATDGSDDAKTAAGFLEQLPLPAATAVRIVSVVTLPPSPIDVPPVRAYYSSLLAQGQHIVDDTRASFSQGLSTETRVLEGEARGEIVREAREWGANLVVVGARGLGALAGFFFGSVSIAVARHVDTAVLVVKGHPQRLEQVVVGLDGSDESLNAARFVAALPLAPSLSVRLVGVVEPLHLMAPGIARKEIATAIHQMEEARRANLDKALGQAAALFEAHGIAVARTTLQGRPAEVIVAAAQPPDADLIVVGARGLGGFGRLLLGSVSENVLRAARCPVLIVKPPHAPQERRQ